MPLFHFFQYVSPSIEVESSIDIESEIIPENTKDYISHRVGKDVGTGDILYFVTEHSEGGFLEGEQIEADASNINEASLYRELMPHLSLEDLITELQTIGGQIYSV